ncbi:MAG: hypothetical protein JO189_30670 [Deltaproteobacteria bacterium]|nr:hypothetical protein [Deltaproteobacteria bacterium]
MRLRPGDGRETHGLSTGPAKVVFADGRAADERRHRLLPDESFHLARTSKSCRSVGVDIKQDTALLDDMYSQR